MPAAHAYHDQAGDVFAAHAAVAPHNAYPDRSAMLALAGDVAGRRILDAGCSGGQYAAEPRAVETLRAIGLARYTADRAPELPGPTPARP